ncbi:uncharacterized protein LOC114934610 [Nylanderia fulva]|uniref:uncharacterized protein LOC114934610 n=1 Tax=Nylanderia fulva TaxID=613905 RepID=UPI0010FB7687|nr:uncharacterized protein LOC114934610 [Nylanderia fulva]
MTSISDTTLENSATLNSGDKTTTMQANRKGNSEEYKLMLFLKNTFDKGLFHKDFDTWKTEEQYSWIKENLSKFYPNVPETLLQYIPAYFRQPDFDRSSVDMPDWLDINKYRRGQKFVSENSIAIIISNLLGLIHVYTFEEALKPIIIGGHGHTIELGLKRYESTGKRIMSWYRGEPWVKGTEAYKNMQTTHKLHLMMRKKLCQMDNEQIDAAAKIAELYRSDREILLEDFATACPLEKIGQRPYIAISESPHKPKGINNMDLAAVQAGFIGLFLVRPQDIGVHNATDQDIEAFCHMWRCYGHYLGLEDEYNFCRGSFEEIKQRAQDFYKYWITSNFKNVSPEWEHMTRCVIEPIHLHTFLYMPYKTMLLIALDLLDLNMPRLYTSLSYSEWIAYKIYKFILQYALKLSIVRDFFNNLMKRAESKQKQL